MTVVVCVEGLDAEAVTTAIAIEIERGRPFRALVGAQVERVRPRGALLNTTVIDTTQGQGGRGDGH